MSDIGNSIRAAREKLGISQADLARRVGISQPAIQKIEDGRTEQSKYLPQIAVILGLDLQTISQSATQATPASGFVPESRIFASTGEKLPVYASAEGGPGELVVNTDPVDWMPKPAPVASVRGAYGLIITGYSMIPEFEPGDTAIVNPHLPVTPGSTYIFYAERDGSARATIKRLRKATTESWLVSQWNPPEGMRSDFSLSRREWGVCHRVLGKFSR